MQVLKIGSRGFQVEFLQCLLNKSSARDFGRAAINVDGIFGPQTDAVVRAFQSRHKPLRVDGIVENQTWNALGLHIEKEHFIRLIGQPAGMGCWAAAARMILGKQSVGGGNGIFDPSGNPYFTVQALESFASSLGWRKLYYSPFIQELTGLSQRTPLWICESGAGWTHAVVLSGVYSDGDASGTGTMFRIHDPLPPVSGKIYGSFTEPFTVFAADGRTRIPSTLDYILVPD